MIGVVRSRAVRLLEVAGLAGMVASLSTGCSVYQAFSFGWPEGIARRFDLEGWDAVTVDGRDPNALEEALSRDETERPVCVVATVRR